MRLLPETMWGALYIEVDGKMLFRRLTSGHQGESASINGVATGFTCELLEFARCLGSNFASILSGERGIRPAELIGCGVTIWFRRGPEHISLYFNEPRSGFASIFKWVPILLQVFVAETHQLLVSIWSDVGRLNPQLNGDPLILRHIQAAEEVKQQFEEGCYETSRLGDQPTRLGTVINE